MPPPVIKKRKIVYLDSSDSESEVPVRFPRLPQLPAAMPAQEAPQAPAPQDQLIPAPQVQEVQLQDPEVLAPQEAAQVPAPQEAPQVQLILTKNKQIT